MGIDKMDRRELHDSCNTFIYSKSASDLYKEARGYLTGILRSRPDEADKESDFENSLGWKKHLFRAPVIGKLATPAGLWYLQRDGRDALMLELGEKMIGHTAFHVHNDDNSLHVFSVYVDKAYRHNGLATRMVEDVLKEAKGRKIGSMRIGGGNSDETNGIYSNFCGRAKELNLLPREESWRGKNWFDLIYREI